jgi:hypothetical protein
MGTSFGTFPKQVPSYGQKPFYSVNFDGILPGAQQQSYYGAPNKEQLFQDTLNSLKGIDPKDRASIIFAQMMSKPQYSLAELADFRKKEAAEAQKLGKESAAEAFRYSMIGKGIDALTSGIKTAIDPFGGYGPALLAIENSKSDLLNFNPRQQIVTPNIISPATIPNTRYIS